MTRRRARARTGSALPLSSCSPASSYAIAALGARRVASPTSTVPGSAADWTRDAVLTRSPATMPCAVGADRHRRLAGEHAGARRVEPGSCRARATAATSSSAARTARSASSSCATGAPQTAMTASPMNFSTVPP